MKIFPIIILFAFGILLMSCSSIPEQNFNTKGISPREVFVQFDSIFLAQNFVYTYKKLSQFKLSNGNSFEITSIRTDNLLKENTCYNRQTGSFRIKPEIPTSISYKLDSETLHQLSEEFESNIQFCLDSNIIQLDLRAVNEDEYLYCFQAETGKRNRISWMLSIYAIADSTMKIKKILYYYSGHKYE